MQILDCCLTPSISFTEHSRYRNAAHRRLDVWIYFGHLFSIKLIRWNKNALKPCAERLVETIFYDSRCSDFLPTKHYHLRTQWRWALTSLTPCNRTPPSLVLVGFKERCTCAWALPPTFRQTLRCSTRWKSFITWRTPIYFYDTAVKVWVGVPTIIGPRMCKNH